MSGFLSHKVRPSVGVMSVDDNDILYENDFDCDGNAANCACYHLFDYEPFYNPMPCYINKLNETITGSVLMTGSTKSEPF